jgi:hypothetical protein
MEGDGMNPQTIRIILAAAAFLILSGCNLELKTASGSLPVEALAKTAANQTLSAGSGNPLPTAGSIDTPGLALPTNTLTPTPTFTATLSPTPEKVTVTVSKNTNCRTGPEKQFDLAGIMMVGETAEAIGRNADSTYWVIHLPSKPEKTCWLWYEWATVAGPGQSLPVIQSPPTPTWSPKPDFSFQFIGVTTCGGTTYVRLQLSNIGNMTWESYQIRVEDVDAATTQAISLNVFEDHNGCTVSSVPSVPPGGTANLIGIAPPGSAGHHMAVTLHLYTQDTGGGTHMTGDFSFTMP